MAADSSSSSSCPFDAVLLIAFGGPQGPADVRPFLENVTGGRMIAPDRIERAVGNYMRIDGVSPLTVLTQRQADGLRDRLRDLGIDVPVHVGMRNWHPFLADVFCEMSQAGVRRAVGFIAAAHESYPSCGQYKENVVEARGRLRERGLPDVEITYVDSWYDHPGFITALSGRIETALEKLDPDLRDDAHIVFTAHSIPTKMAEVCEYRQQVQATARLVAEQVGHREYVIAYQSRSGSPREPWLEPDICDCLRGEHAKGFQAVVISPVGFLCDHIEVLCDLDVEAAEVCRRLNLPMVRAETVNDDPAFIGMMADVVKQKLDEPHL